MNYVSSPEDFSFSRKLFIKNLFDVKGIFYSFNQLHFLSFAAFSNFIKADLFFSKSGDMQEYVIDIITEDELKAMLDIIRSTELDSKKVITLRINMNTIESSLELITDQKIKIMMTPETIEKLIIGDVLFPINAELWTEYIFTADNYAEEYEKLIKLFLKNPRFALIDLKFDYVSFENKPISELHKLYFYVNMLRIWIESGSIATEKEGCTPQSYDTSTKIILKNQGVVRCYVNENLDILLNKDEVYFSMVQYLNMDGEGISNKDLNYIRKIIDIKFSNFSTSNWYLVDLYQNNKIMEDHYLIPTITKLVHDWLNLTREK